MGNDVRMDQCDILRLDYDQIAFAFRMLHRLLGRPELNMHSMIMRNRVTAQVARLFGM
jgi:hypothetical protein